MLIWRQLNGLDAPVRSIFDFEICGERLKTKNQHLQDVAYAIGSGHKAQLHKTNFTDPGHLCVSDVNVCRSGIGARS